MKYLLSFILVLVAGFVNAQRTVLPINEGWQFIKGDISIGQTEKNVQWKTVNLPHTWNVEDVMDDTPGYYRGVGSYRKKLLFDKSFQKKEIYLFFEGANQSVTVYLNGKKAGAHTGGYVGFNVRLTSFIEFGKENELLVKVDNSHNSNIPPLTADFTFYGGIYRQVSLVTVDAVHFSCDDNGSKGIFISTSVVNKESGTLKIRGSISNETKIIKNIRVLTSVYDAAGKEISKMSAGMFAKAGAVKNFNQEIKITQPRLWSPADPYLYKVVTKIIDVKTSKILDELINSIGFRWFSFDAEKGFYLNGEPLKLIGASRHQDYKGMGNAVSDSLARKDVELLKAMGGNFLRVAHYPQDPSVLQACDELGILASVEIPVVNEITESDSFYNNCINMQIEMIRQNYNHSSVIMWCYMNEILLKPQFNNDKERQKIYFANITRLAKTLDSITRKEDPSRYTMMANHGAYSRYREIGLTDIPMIVGWNLYSGWYGAQLNDLPVFLDKFHKDYPTTPTMITEYGADADPRIRSATPIRFDKSVEYATKFHQYYFGEIMKRPFVAAGMVWNLADFNSETRNETMPHINNKGLLEWDRTAKDPYYYYKAKLTQKAFAKILGAYLREGIADSGTSVCYQRIQVTTNVKEIELYVNGQFQSSGKADDGISEWNVPFEDGVNLIQVKLREKGNLYIDQAEIMFRLHPYRLNENNISYKNLNILLGAKRYFTDQSNEIWIPDQEYCARSWGHIGGKPFKLTGGNLPYGTDKNIKGTDDDPVYQTQQTNIREYKIDAPDGNYEIILHFAELLGGEVQHLVYNLDSSRRTENTVKRIFDVLVNDQVMLKDFNLAEQYGSAIAVRKSIKVQVKNNNGIRIIFKATEGESVLNAIQVKRVDE